MSTIDPQALYPLAQAQPLSSALLVLLDRQGTGFMLKNLDTGAYEQVNEAAGTLFGCHDQEIVGKTDADLFEAQQAVSLRAADQQAVAAGGATLAEHRIERKGERRDYAVVRLALRDAQGRPATLLSLWQDLTDAHRREGQLVAALQQLELQQRTNDGLRRQVHDHLVRDDSSGLYHRAHFEEQLRREADLSAREHREFALVSIQIDHIDELVGEYGEEVRDRVIEALGRVLRQNTRAMDSPCRLGGDRFAVLLSGVGLATAHTRMESLRRQCAEHIVALAGRQVNFTVSMGVASFPHTAGAVDTLLASADAALATARERGGNRIALASIQFELA